MDIKIVNKSNNPLPKFQTSLSVGMDVYSFLSEPCVLEPFERELIGTGLYIELPDDVELQIRPRSGLAFKQGITVLNAPGTIDPDYRGEIKILLVNLSNKTVTINSGERVAQFIFAKFERPNLVIEEELSNTNRGEGGFGHTGKQ